MKNGTLKFSIAPVENGSLLVVNEKTYIVEDISKIGEVISRILAPKDTGRKTRKPRKVKVAVQEAPTPAPPAEAPPAPPKRKGGRPKKVKVEVAPAPAEAATV